MDTDDALIAGLTANLDGTFEALVLAHQDRLYSIALRVLGDPADAEEAAQDALVRAYRALAGYDAARIRELRLRPWLATIVLNLCRSRRTRGAAARATAVAGCAATARRGTASRRGDQSDGRGRSARRAGHLGGPAPAPLAGAPRAPSSCAMSTASPTPKSPSPSAGPRAPSRRRSIAAWPCCAPPTKPTHRLHPEEMTA